MRWQSIWLMALLPAACNAPERAAGPEPAAGAGAALVVYAPATTEPDLARVFADYSDATGIAGRHAFHATVTVTEITGSESFVHLNRDASNWVAVLQGVHEFEPGHLLDAVLDPDNVFVFDAAGRLVASPGAL